MLPEQVVVEVTERCNNDCLHCYNYWRGSQRTHGTRGELSRGDILTLIRKARESAPLRQVSLSGGEPMLRHDLAEIVRDLADEGLETVVITNGTLLREARLRLFPATTVFEVTLLGADAALHDRLAGRAAHSQVVAGLKELERQHRPFALVVVVTRDNAHQIGQTLRLGLALGAGAILLNRVNLTRRSAQHARLVPSVDALRGALAEADQLACRYGAAISVSVPIPPCLLDPSEFPHLNFGWCPRGGPDAYYTIGCTGLVRPCNHSSVVLGDLQRQRFEDIVAGSKAQDFWSPTPRECLACQHPLRTSCRGGCPAAADECYGRRDRVDPIVELGLATRD